MAFPSLSAPAAAKSLLSHPSRPVPPRALSSSPRPRRHCLYCIRAGSGHFRPGRRCPPSLTSLSLNLRGVSFAGSLAESGEWGRRRGGDLLVIEPLCLRSEMYRIREARKAGVSVGGGPPPPRHRLRSNGLMSSADTTSSASAAASSIPSPSLLGRFVRACGK